MNTELADTITAISTPIGEGGIGIVRISGKDALKLADKIFKRNDAKSVRSFKTYTIHYGRIVADKNDKKSGVIDEVILTVMRAPKSYTTEDIVEINCHGGIVPLKKVLDVVVSHGARLAAPGEFTKRAFINGRIDLAQAEAVLDVIRAKTDRALKVALNQLSGKLSSEVLSIYDELSIIFTHIQASIDFPDEDLGIETYNQFINVGNEIKKHIEKLLSEADRGIILREGLLALIYGKPNVGKSSLLNAFLRQERAIVNPLPGTTRDSIEEMVNIDGIPLRIVDTAGIGESENLIEKEGIRRATVYLDKADIVLFVIDASTPIDKRDKVIARQLSKKKVILVLNKIDLPKKINVEEITATMGSKTVVEVSALKKININSLEKAIRNLVLQGGVEVLSEPIVSNVRHKEALRQTLLSVSLAVSGLVQKKTPELVSMDIKEAIENIGSIIGVQAKFDVLDRIFSEFCIGK